MNEQLLREFVLITGLGDFLSADNVTEIEGAVTPDEFSRLQAIVDTIPETDEVEAEVIALARRMVRESVERLLALEVTNHSVN
ncbi:hypothetical protein [Paenibacillus elgii]|uniref:hypothetical protein n=1 Tax=Paenibacillus elgii TaxID=189691 RepID=UPI000248C2EC|nr:hypothetical protein [Paenibacillus elgii]